MNTPDEKTLLRLRIRIAVLMGWAEAGPGARVYQHAVTESCVWDYDLPDYTGSLDAIHEASKELITGSNDVEFATALAQLIGIEQRHLICLAEAWQRAIALDRTLSQEPIV